MSICWIRELKIFSVSFWKFENHQNKLLLEILTDAIDEEDRIMCSWGGRGRAGLTAGCLLSLLYPDVSADVILNLIQGGYDTRLGAKDMPWGLSKSSRQNHNVNLCENL